MGSRGWWSSCEGSVKLAGRRLLYGVFVTTGKVFRTQGLRIGITVSFRTVFQNCVARSEIHVVTSRMHHRVRQASDDYISRGG